MEKELRISLSEKKFLYGRFSGSRKQPLFIVIHGLPGNGDEYFYHKATDWCSGKGYATFRPNLYDWHKDSRQLIDSTLATHASDIDSMVRHFRKEGFKKIFIAGHSYGGPSILLSRDQDFNAVMLWDPSYKSSFTKERYGFPGGTYISQVKGYFMKWGVGVVIGKKMAEEADSLDWDTLPKNFRAPLRIISAGSGILVPGAEKYISVANKPNSLQIIPEATHYFDTKKGMQEKVFKLSEDWFKKF